MPALNKPNS